MTSKYADTFTIPGLYDYAPDFMIAGSSSREHMDKIKLMSCERDDVIVDSYPRCGFTLLQEIVWLLKNQADEEKAKTPNYERVPLVDEEVLNPLLLIESMEKPRIIGSHLPYQHLPVEVINKGVKVCYVYRNPRDTLVSHYYYYKMFNELGPFEGTWDDFFDYFYRVRQGNILYGSILMHVKSFWLHKSDPNLLITTYEDLVKNPKSEVRKIADFLGVDHDVSLIDKVCEMTRFDVMKANPATNYEGMSEYLVKGAPPFIRRGKVGGWAEYFSDAQITKLDEMVKKELGGTDIHFVYE